MLPAAVTPRTLPPLVTIFSPSRRVPACSTFTPAICAASFRPRISLPVSNLPGYPADARTTHALAPGFHRNLSGSSRRAGEHLSQVEVHPRRDCLRFRIPQPAVEFQHFGPFFRQHQPDVEKSLVAYAV